jgi:hypothetical protein
MKTQLMFGAAILAVIALTGCRTYKVTIKDNNGVVTASPDPVTITQNSGTVKVVWKAENPGPWLVDFLVDTPCSGLHVFQNGGTTVCVIDMSQYAGPTYKYYAIAGQHVSADPQIYHMPTQGQPTTEKQPTGKAPTVVCVNLPNGSPQFCDSNTAEDPVKASKGNIIYWQPDNGWTITIAAGVCGDGGTQTKISSSSGYCVVTGSNGTYQYSVMLNNNTYGPFSVQVQ